MRLLREMETIQIEITNACVHACSNCTRMCGNHKKPFFMDFNTFQNAVDSLEGFEGVLGLMGGEPVIHPEFDRFLAYAASKVPNQTLKDQYFYSPKKDYMETAWSYSYLMKQMVRFRGIGLWTSIPKPYYNHYELITDHVTFYRLNDHSHPSQHQPVMVSYKDLGISDDEFTKLRDNCWLQNKWSAAITPKGAFFCEIAAALDMLFDGPGGWKVELGWWKRQIKDYADQWHWCELCGICLDTMTRDANEEIDDVSETLYKKLEEIDSPRLKKGSILIYDKNGARNQTRENLDGNYLLDYTKRIGTSRQNLLPKSMKILAPDALEKIQRLDDLAGCDWIVVQEGKGSEKLEKEVQKLENMFLNPGVLYQVDMGNCQAKIFHTNASAVNKITKENQKYNGSDNRNKKEIDWQSVLSNWPEEKKYTITSGFENEPDVDYAFHENNLLKAYMENVAFMAELEKRLSRIEKAQPVLLPMVSHLYNVRAFARLLSGMGHNVHIMASKQHERSLLEIVPDVNLHCFGHDRFVYKALEEYVDIIKGKHQFAGCIIPTSIAADHIISHDGYDELFKVMSYMNVPVLGVINGKMRFCE